MLTFFPNELILKIGSYCSIKELCSLSEVCKIIAKLRLYRLCISNIACNRFCGTYSYKDLQREFNDFFNLSPYYTYTCDEYIRDLYTILFNDYLIYSNDYHRYKHKYFSIQYSHSLKLIEIIENKYRLTKNSIIYNNKIKFIKRCHRIYRVCPIAYYKLRKRHINVLALIY